MAINSKRGLFRVYIVLDVIIFIISMIIMSDEVRLYWDLDDVVDDWADYLIATGVSISFCAIPWSLHYLLKWLIKGFYDEQKESVDSNHAEPTASPPRKTKAPPMEYSEIALHKGGVPFVWRRFWARVIDFACIAILSDIMILLVVGLVLSKFPNVEKRMLIMIKENPTSYVFMILVAYIITIFTLILYEATCLRLIGTTLGKALFGMKVRNTDGSKLNFATAYRRSSRAYASGLWFLIGFPALTIWPLLRSLNFIRKNNETTWDKSFGTTLFLKHICTFRAFAMSAIGFCCLFSYFSLRLLAKKENQKEIRDRSVDLMIERALENVENQLATIVQESNKDLPKWLSNELRLDKLESKGNRTLETVYTCRSLPEDYLAHMYIEEHYKPPCLESIKTNPGFEVLRNNSVTFVFSYLDMNGQLIGYFTIDPADYKEE